MLNEASWLAQCPRCRRAAPSGPAGTRAHHRRRGLGGAEEVPVQLRTLVASPELRLRVLTGGDALDRQVGGVFTTDLLDPSRYLSGGEIVLTGLMWRRAPADSAAFVSALVAAGVAALAAGDAALGSVPPDLVEACRAQRLPLLEVPVDVSFAAITERVMRSLLPAGPGAAVARLRRLAGAEAAAPT